MPPHTHAHTDTRHVLNGHVYVRVCLCVWVSEWAAYKRDFIRSPSVEAEKIKRIKYKNGNNKKKEATAKWNGQTHTNTQTSAHTLTHTWTKHNGAGAPYSLCLPPPDKKGPPTPRATSSYHPFIPSRVKTFPTQNILFLVFFYGLNEF